MIPLLDRLNDPRPVLLDGATGTELARRGADLDSPDWTAGTIREQPQLLHEVHRDYVDAGAEIVTANTFRTHARNLAAGGRAGQAEELTRRAVEIARSAADERAFVAGCVAPLEDCYSPRSTPSEGELEDEHRRMIGHLLNAGVDLVLIETQVTIREAAIACRLAARYAIPFLVSFVCNRRGGVLSGEPVPAAFEAVAGTRPAAFLVNCIPADEVLETLRPVLPRCREIRAGAYANTGRLLADGTWESTSGVVPAVYAGFAKSWVEGGCGLVGGCCGTTPEHISAVHRALYEK